MPDNPSEPPDGHTYQWLSMFPETAQFYLAAVKFYESRLQEDVAAIEADPDLKAILGQAERDSFPIERERARVARVRESLEKHIAGTPPGIYFEFNISHGWIRFIKSVSLLYLNHLQQRRDAVASRPAISRYALAALDQRLAQLREKTELGVFQTATPTALLLAPAVETQSSNQPAPSPEVPSCTARALPRPAIIGGVEVFDDVLRKRCLDLLEQFSSDGQHERLDTVVTEATRILEDRLRQLSGADPECIGVELANYCFGDGANARLRVSAIDAEQNAAHLLFRGVFGFVRNAVHHRLVATLQPARALQIVALVDYLLFVAHGAETRPPVAVEG